MSKYLRHLAILALFVPVFASAGWKVAGSRATGPFYQTGQKAGCSGPNCKKNELTRRSAAFDTFPLYAGSFNGSLKTNLSRLLGRYHWRLKWLLPLDFHLDGRIASNTLEGLVEKMVKYFPLKATFYKGNRVVTVTSRTKKC
jgi:hypothetical protein